MNMNMASRVTVLAVGVENYQNMRRLRGPINDISNLRQLLVESNDTALYEAHQFIKLHNPTTEELRSVVSDYTLQRSARGDILVFYFSGHGKPVGRDDFGFCATDTLIHPGVNTVLPLTVFKFSDLLESLSIMDVTPVVIIDACYSGSASSALHISPRDAIITMQSEIRRVTASNHALLCSCSDMQVSFESPTGGVFSQYLFEIASEGIQSRNKFLLGLQDMFPLLTERIETDPADANPRLYLGDTLPDFPFVKNVGYTTQTERFTSYLKQILNKLWNNGNERELSRNEILTEVGTGAYGNHSKLSYAPWLLVEDNPENRKRRLTTRGRKFVQGKITIPQTIQKDPITNEWLDAPDTNYIDISHL